jgi:hypothetical protein
MFDTESPSSVERAEIVERDGSDGREAGADRPERDEFIEQPAKVMRVGTMMKQLLEEVRSASLDEASRDRLRDIYETSVNELGSALSPDLREELGRLALPFSDDVKAPTAAELQIAQAQLVGWLEGLIQGIQATLFAQQMAAQQQLANMRGQIGPGGRPVPPGAPRPPLDAGAEGRPGTYL